MREKEKRGYDSRYRGKSPQTLSTKAMEYESDPNRTVGCFEFRLLAPVPCPVEQSGRWEVLNLLTMQRHVTFGTEKDMREGLSRMSEAWKRKVESMKHAGYAWRGAP